MISPIFLFYLFYKVNGMLDMSMLSNQWSSKQARDSLSTVLIKQLKEAQCKDHQRYEVALFRASALLIKFKGKALH